MQTQNPFISANSLSKNNFNLENIQTITKKREITKYEKTFFNSI